MAERNPHRVGILIGSLTSGGAERMALHLQHGLLAAGLEVHLIALDRDREALDGGETTASAGLPQRIHCLSDNQIDASTLRKVLAAPGNAPGCVT